MYLLSVVIPTKDRFEYLQSCVESLIRLRSDELEIVVQDNTDDDSPARAFIARVNWPHLKYFHQRGDLSQTENSDLAVSHATGLYCTYIGDDDSIAESALDAARYLRDNDLPACANNVATYHWPDVVFRGKPKPALSFDDRPGRVEPLRSDRVLADFLRWGCQDIKYLPRIYHGIIRRDILEQIKARTGSYFPGPSPDMANAVAALLLIDRYVYVHLPLIVSGYSYKSAGGMGLRGAHSGSLKGVKQLPANAEAEWSERIPKVWLGYTVWPESAEKAFQRMGRPEYVEKINYSAMYAKIFLKYANYRKMVLQHVRGVGRLFRFAWECAAFMLRWTGERADLKRRKRKGLQYIVEEHVSLSDACAAVDRQYQKADCLRPSALE